MGWIKQQIEWVKSFFSEKNGKASLKRLISILVVLAFLISYVKTSLDIKQIEDIPTNWAFLIAAILGIMVAANKVVNEGNKKNE